MLIIEHRKNSSAELVAVPTSNGVEIDVRSNQEGLYLSHDPYDAGESFHNWLKSYRHELIVVNVKEEGLENSCLSLLEDAGVSNFFFLDQSTPF